MNKRGVYYFACRTGSHLYLTNSHIEAMYYAILCGHITNRRDVEYTSIFPTIDSIARQDDPLLVGVVIHYYDSTKWTVIPINEFIGK